MPANTTLTIADGAATPVNHTFYPTKIDSNNVAIFEERTSGVPIGYPRLTWSLRAPTAQQPAYKAVGKLSIPKVVQTVVNGVTTDTVDYANLGTIELVMSAKSTKQDRTNLRKMVSNMLTNATLVVSVDDLENFW